MAFSFSTFIRLIAFTVMTAIVSVQPLTADELSARQQWPGTPLVTSRSPCGSSDSKRESPQQYQCDADARSLVCGA